MRRAEELIERTSDATDRDRALISARQGEPMEPAGKQLQALLDIASVLNAASIPYALIGGIAVGIHSERPRATVDVDIAASTAIPRTLVVRTLTEAGFEPVGEFEHSLNFRHANGEPVQVSLDPLFDAMIERAETAPVRDVPLRIVTLDDLIASKQRAADDPSRRPSKALRDRADIALLKGDVADEDEGW